MKRTPKIIVLFLASLCALSITAFAAEGVMPFSSSYIFGIHSNIVAGKNGSLTISFRLNSPAPMTELGASSIDIYENNGQTTKLVKTVYATDDGYSYLLGSGTYHSGNITYSGTIGYKYYAKVHFTASDNTGGDTATSTSPTVTAKK